MQSQCLGMLSARIMRWLLPIGGADWLGDLLYVPEALYCVGSRLQCWAGREPGVLMRRSRRHSQARTVGATPKYYGYMFLDRAVCPTATGGEGGVSIG